MAIKRRRVVVRNLVRTSVEGAAVKHSLTLSKSQRPVFGWSSKSRFSQGANTRQPNLGVDSGAHDRTTEKRASGRVDRCPGPQNPDSRTMFSDWLSVIGHRFHDEDGTDFRRPGRRSLSSAWFPPKITTQPRQICQHQTRPGTLKNQENKETVY